MQRLGAILVTALALSLLVAPSAPFRVVARQSCQRYDSGIAGGGLCASKNDGVAETRNPIYQLLSTPRDNKPGRSNFFYNDEVVSHLHGYMFLVGSLAAYDEVRVCMQRYYSRQQKISCRVT
jgi:hypothetical protein